MPHTAAWNYKVQKKWKLISFLQISPRPWLKLRWERERQRKTEGDRERPRGAYSIRPLGVTVLSRIRSAPTHKHTATKWCHVRASIVRERLVWLSVCHGSTERACATLGSPLQGQVINGPSNNFSFFYFFLQNQISHRVANTDQLWLPRFCCLQSEHLAFFGLKTSVLSSFLFLNSKISTARHLQSAVVIEQQLLYEV